MSEDKNHPTAPKKESARASRRVTSTSESARGGDDGQTVAVALDYDPISSTSAPRVLATGRGAVAEQILELAFAHGVKVRQDADLVQILSAVDVDSEIPVEAFAAVAEILAYVYRANGQLGGAEEGAGTSATAFSAAMADDARAQTSPVSPTSASLSPLVAPLPLPPLPSPGCDSSPSDEETPT